MRRLAQIGGFVIAYRWRAASLPPAITSAISACVQWHVTADNHNLRVTTDKLWNKSILRVA